jgi:hypothetical protein
VHGPTCIFWATLTPFSLQAKCQGNNWIAGNLGWLIGSSFWSRHIFDGTASGVWSAMPLWCSCLLYTASGILALVVGYSEGWRIGCGPAASIDTRDHFLRVFDNQNRKPQPTPTWCLVAFGGLFGAVMFGTPGDICGVLAPLFGIGDRSRISLGFSSSWQADVLFYAGCIGGAAFGIRYMLSAEPDVVTEAAKGKQGTMLGDFLNPTFDGALAARSGEAMSVLDDSDAKWLLVRNAAGTNGWVPRSGVSGYVHAGGSAAGYAPPVEVGPKLELELAAPAAEEDNNHLSSAR